MSFSATPVLWLLYITLGCSSAVEREQPQLPALTPNLPAWANQSNLVLLSDFATAPILNGGVENADKLRINSDTQDGVPFGAPRTDVNRLDPTAPISTAVYGYDYPGSDAGNGVGVAGGALLGPSGLQAKRLYAAFTVRFTEGYVTHTNQEKLFYPLGTHSTALNIAIAPGTDAFGPAVFAIQTQTGIGPVNVTQSTGPQVTKGVWHRVEVEMIQNSTAGSTDGQLRVWLNGVLAFEHVALNFGGSDANPVFTTPRWASTRGGGASMVLTPPAGQGRRFSVFTVYASESLGN